MTNPDSFGSSSNLARLDGGVPFPLLIQERNGEIGRKRGLLFLFNIGVA